MADKTKSNTGLIFGVLGTVAAIGVIYFGFTEKGKQKWSVMFDPTKGGTNVDPRTALTAEDATLAVNKGADGLDATPRKAGFGSGFGSNGADGVMTRGVFPFASSARMKPGTKKVVRGEVCEWNGSEWVNCKKLQVA